MAPPFRLWLCELRRRLRSVADTNTTTDWPAKCSGDDTAERLKRRHVAQGGGGRQPARRRHISQVVGGWCSIIVVACALRERWGTERQTELPPFIVGLCCRCCCFSLKQDQSAEAALLALLKFLPGLNALSSNNNNSNNNNRIISPQRLKTGQSELRLTTTSLAVVAAVVWPTLTAVAVRRRPHSHAFACCTSLQQLAPTAATSSGSPPSWPLLLLLPLVP